MRIVQIGSYPKFADHIVGGIEASVYGLSQTLGRECDVHVFDVPRMHGFQGVEKDGNVTVHRFANQGRRQMFTMRQVKRIAGEICNLNPDVCHVHGTSLYMWLMYRALRNAQQSVVVTVHGLARVEKRNALRKGFSMKKVFQYLYQAWSEKCFLSQLPMAIVDTEYVKDMVDSYPIVRKPEMHVIPQGIDESFFSLNCSENSRVILSVGAIGARKGHLITLRAFEHIRRMGCDARLIIAGTVADYSYFEQLRNAIVQSDYGEEVSLQTDLSNEELRHLYAEAHLFALHSEEESQGIVFVEAMAMGLPIVGTNVGGIPFVVGHGKNGLLSDYGDVNTFAEHIYCLMTDTTLWRIMSEASVSVSYNYHWIMIGDRIKELYQSLGSFIAKNQ